MNCAAAGLIVTISPSYEIMMDELRDYRFYADDMLHPSPVAVSYLWECFTECYFSKETDRIMKEWEDIRKALAHKPFNAQSETYRKFLTQIVLKIERLKEKFPYFDLQKRIRTMSSSIENIKKVLGAKRFGTVVHRLIGI